MAPPLRHRLDGAVAGERDRHLADPGGLGRYLERLDLDGLRHAVRAVPEHADMRIRVVGERVPDRDLAVRVFGPVRAGEAPRPIPQAIAALGPLLPELRRLLQITGLSVRDAVQSRDPVPRGPVRRNLDDDATPLHCPLPPSG